MPIDGLVFTAIAQELGRLLKSARVQGVFQPSPHDLILQMRQPGETLRLLISIDPVLARVHLTEEEFENPLSPPPFCLLLRKHLLPGRVVDVRQAPFERVLEIIFEGLDDAGDRTRRRLIAEVMGRHSNVVLVDEEGTILDAMRRVPGDVNRHREVLPNRPYTPPPSQDRLIPSALGPEEFDRLIRLVPSGARPAKVLSERVAGFSPLAGREVVARAGLEPDICRDQLGAGEIEALFRAFSGVVRAVETGSLDPCAIETDEAPEFWILPLQTIAGRSKRFDSMNRLLDWTYRRRAAAERFQRTKKALSSLVDQHLRRVARKSELQRQEVEAAKLAEEYRVAGDLLTSYLHLVPPGTSSVELPNFYDGERPVVIALDPRESPAANAQRYYRKYQKAKKTMEKAKEHLEASLAELEYLESVKTALLLCEAISELEEIEAELEKGGYIEKSLTHERRRKPSARREAPAPLAFTSSDGFRVLVGRNNRQNDLLTMEIAKGDDLWLHTKEIPGAHVIVQTRGKSVPEQTLVEAAMLAAYYSRARDSANVPVDYTFRRHVRKPRGARPGMVIYDHQRTLFVTPDPGLISRLGSAFPDEGPANGPETGTGRP